MSRREIRERIFQILFRIEFHPEGERDEQLLYSQEDEDIYSQEDEDREASDAEASYIRNKIRAVAERTEEIDGMLNAVAKGWKTARMGKVDLTLLRLAVYEIRFDDNIPTNVAINEAVELAKKYGTNHSSSFVNGILAKLV